MISPRLIYSVSSLSCVTKCTPLGSLFDLLVLCSNLCARSKTTVVSQSQIGCAASIGSNTLRDTCARCTLRAISLRDYTCTDTSYHPLPALELRISSRRLCSNLNGWTKMRFSLVTQQSSPCHDAEPSPFGLFSTYQLHVHVM
jgi:hypothetical protein